MSISLRTRTVYSLEKEREICRNEHLLQQMICWDAYE